MEHMRQYGGDMNSGMYDGGGGGGGGGGGQYPYGMNMGMMGMPPMGYNVSHQSIGSFKSL